MLPSKASVASLFKSLTSDTNDELCSTCRSFHPQDLPSSDKLLGSEAEISINLGTVQELLARQNCSFCRLVLHLVYDRVAIGYRQDIASCGYQDQTTHTKCAIRRKRNVFEVLNQYGLQGYICSSVRTSLPTQALEEMEYAGSTFGRQLKMPLVREWIRECQADHLLCRLSHSATSDRDPISLTLIDVRNNCLLEATSVERYFALSYVWGAVQGLRTTKSNKDALHAFNSLLERKNEIPQAIQDAMVLASLLNERYLWVDSLCIVQDDEISKHEQIQRMNVVYGHAFLTIIAVSGQDANCPLPGVGLHSRPQLFAVADTAGNRLISRPLKIKQLLQSSPYESRAWTFQERLLSRRCLILTTHQAYYHCSTGLRSDVTGLFDQGDSENLVSLNPVSHLLGVRPDTAPHSPSIMNNMDFSLYNDLVREYSTRALSFPSDKLSAFAGIEAVLKENFHTDFIYGLPEKIIDIALHWISEREKGEMSNTRVENRNQGFPSWSWAGHIGPVRYFNGPLQCLKDWAPEPPVISKVGYFKVTINNAYRTLRRLRSNLIQFDSNAAESPSEEPAISMSQLRNGTLSFQASCTSLESFSIEGVEWDSSFLILYDSDRHCCGRVWPDWPESKFDPQSLQTSSCDLCLISFSEVMDEKDPIQLGYHFDVDRFSITERSICMANALLVSSYDGRCERIAIVQMHIKAWENARQTEKNIDLQ